jgi:hypothetical protein
MTILYVRYHKYFSRRCLADEDGLTVDEQLQEGISFPDNHDTAKGTWQQALRSGELQPCSITVGNTTYGKACTLFQISQRA